MIDQNELIEAAEAVVATANGNTYGLTVQEQLDALRLACDSLREALEGEAPYAVMPCGAYVDDRGDYNRHQRNCRDCREIVEANRADMIHSDGGR